MLRGFDGQCGCRAPRAEVLIGDPGPLLAPLDEFRSGVPFASLGAKSLVGQVSQGQQDVRMRVVQVVSVQRDVGHHATRDERALSEVAQEFYLSLLCELYRESDFDLSGELGVLAALDTLDGIPEGFAVVDPGGGFCGARISVCSTPDLRV